ncbi:MAG TPA: hypothetical protein VNR38_11460 [Ureibacillus sp.]|nr:hypothetical protein [Ureibacillus sp.]
MMQRNFLLLVIVVFILSGCQSKTLTFEGESENWAAKITAMQDDNREIQDFVLVYQGEEKESVAGMEVNYKIEDHTGSSGGRGTLKGPGVLQIKGYSNCSGCAFVYEGTEIKITVEWEDKTETILLKAQ